MKKLITFALLTCMLLSVVLPVSVYAAPSVDGTDSNTGRFFNKTSNTGLDAYPGTATIDGVWDENDDWSNAIPLTLNATTKGLITDNAISDTYDGDFYLLWDEDGLYIMEVQRSWSSTVVTRANALASKPRPWRTNTSGELRAWGTQIIAVANQKFVQNTSFSKMLFVFQTSTDAEGETLQVGDSSTPVYVDRTMKYTSWPGAVTGSYGNVAESIDGIECMYTKTADKQYVMELKMSWDYLGMSNKPSEATEADIVDAVGLRLGMGFAGGTHLSKLNSGSDGTGFDPVTLKANAANKVEAIDTVEAEAYWTDATTGQFIVNADATEYEISTAEQLLGLSLAMENNANDKAWTEGKTFKLTNDIDLNPSVNWDAYKAIMAAGTMPEGKTVCEYMATMNAPANKWLSLDCFYGTFDGQGHTISGVWALGAPKGTASGVAHWGVFGGYAYRGTAIKNVVLDNGYISSSNSGYFGGVIGGFQHTEGTNDTNTVDDGVLLENIYVGENFTVDASQNTSKQTGGIMGSGDRIAHANSGDVGLLDLTFRNVVFAGHFKGANYYAGAFLGQTTYYFRSTYKVNLNLTDCLITGTYEGTNTDLGSIDETKRYSEFGSEGKKTNCYDFGNGAEQSIPEALAGKWIETSDGVMPVAVADMFTDYYWQATVEKDGVYSVRLIGEIASVDYMSVDFRVEINRASDGKTAVWGYGTNSYVTAKSAYSSILANNQTVTAADLNEGVLDGEDNNMYVMTLNDLDANETYTLSITTFWTLEDGTVIEGHSVKNITPRPWVIEA